MAATSEDSKKIYQFKASNRAIQKIFDAKTTDISFYFACDGNDQKIDAHKTLLSALSAVFEAMFSNNWKESTRVEISDTSFGAFQEFIRYFYSDQIAISAENVGELLYLANKYEIVELVSACSSFLVERVTVDDVVDCISLACLFDLDALKGKCKKIICMKTSQVIESESFLKCDKNALSEILSIDSSECHEESIFDACVKWAQNKCAEQNISAKSGKNLRQMLGSCLHRMRFSEIRMDEYQKRITLYKDIFTKDEIINYINTHTDKNIFARYQRFFIFEFKEPAHFYSNTGISYNVFQVSQNMVLKRFCLDSSSLHQLNSQSANSYKIKVHCNIPDSYSYNYCGNSKVTKYIAGPAPEYGTNCLQFDTAPYFLANRTYRIDMGFKILPKLFIGKSQTVQGVRLCPQSEICFSELFFEKPA